jgi:hypothetical protein
MKALFEVVILPVSDPDRSLQFYRDQVGFGLDVDYAPAPDFRVIQLTPEGSGTSIQFGVGLTDARPGSLQGLYLVVPDIEGSRLELTNRGVAGWLTRRWRCMHPYSCSSISPISRSVRKLSIDPPTRTSRIVSAGCCR